MKYFRYFLSIVSLIGLIQLAAARETPKIYHIPSESLNQNNPAEITCVVAPGDCRLKAVKIFVRNDPAALYKEFAMLYRDGIWYLPLIPEMMRGNNLYYFITAEFDDFTGIAFPVDKPAEKPLKVRLIRSQKK
ncbi:MAG: hypothetical protein PHG61_05240 [Candidatus Marinimicrobia bacterium]|nr:hypothetical protein [Candidatus Neomarinimicrobiota bacterium]